MSGGDVSDDPGGEPQQPGRVPLVERLLPPVDLHGEDGALKPSRMTPREQLVAAGLGFANVALTGVLASLVTKQQVLLLLAGLFASVLMVVGARVGNRLVTLAGLFSSTLLSGSLFFAFALPYYVAAFWIFLKYNRLVKDQAALRRQQRAAQRGTIAPASRPGRTQGKGRASAGGSATGGRTPPPKSKRYTPPKAREKPPPPPPKPPKDRSIVD